MDVCGVICVRKVRAYSAHQRWRMFDGRIYVAIDSSHNRSSAPLRRLSLLCSSIVYTITRQKTRQTNASETLNKNANYLKRRSAETRTSDDAFQSGIILLSYTLLFRGFLRAFSSSHPSDDFRYILRDKSF